MNSLILYFYVIELGDGFNQFIAIHAQCWNHIEGSLMKGVGERNRLWQLITMLVIINLPIVLYGFLEIIPFHKIYAI